MSELERIIAASGERADSLKLVCDEVIAVRRERDALKADLEAEQKLTADVDRLTGENLRLKAELEAERQEVELKRAAMNGMQAEQAELKAKHTNILATDELVVAALRGDYERLRTECDAWKVLHAGLDRQSAAEVAQLRAELEESRLGPHTEAVDKAMFHFHRKRSEVLFTQLHEVREAAEALAATWREAAENYPKQSVVLLDCANKVAVLAKTRPLAEPKPDEQARPPRSFEINVGLPDGRSMRAVIDIDAELIGRLRLCELSDYVKLRDEAESMHAVLGRYYDRDLDAKAAWDEANAVLAKVRS
jgi:hypothetical protein